MCCWENMINRDRRWGRLMCTCHFTHHTQSIPYSETEEAVDKQIYLPLTHTFCLYLSTPLSLPWHLPPCCSLFVVVFPVFVALSPVCLPASDLLQKLTMKLQQKAKPTSELQQLTIYPALQRVINQSHCSACYDDKMAGLLHFIRSSNPCMDSQTHRYRQRCLLLQSSSNILKTLRAGVVLIPDHSPAQNKHTHTIWKKKSYSCRSCNQWNHAIKKSLWHGLQCT